MEQKNKINDIEANFIENADFPDWMKIIKRALEERLRRKHHDKVSK